jgi:hypothetical protein
MLLLAALTGCLEPILTVAAALSSPRSVFSSPHDRRNDASQAQRTAYGSARSDLLAIAAAYSGWIGARSEGGKAERSYCDSHYLASRALREVEAERRALLQQLHAVGFIPATPAQTPSSTHGGKAETPLPVPPPDLPEPSPLAGKAPEGPPAAPPAPGRYVPPSQRVKHESAAPAAPNDVVEARGMEQGPGLGMAPTAPAASEHSENEALLRGVICAALYPNVASATRTTAHGSHSTYEKLALPGVPGAIGSAVAGRPAKGGGAKGGGPPRSARGALLARGGAEMAVETQAWMHPSSINAQPERCESGLYVYVEKVSSLP